MKSITITMIHDLVCSWCPIGHANVRQALVNLDIDATIRFLPFEINPDMGQAGEAIEDYFARRFRWDTGRQRAYRRHLLTVAEQAGVQINFSKRTHYFNTANAHRLMHWSEGLGKQQAMHQSLCDAYYRHGLDISDTQILLACAEQAGLDRQLASAALASDEVSRQVQLKKQRVQQLDLHTVPAFIIGQDTVITGSQSVELFEQQINEELAVADARPEPIH